MESVITAIYRMLNRTGGVTVINWVKFNISRLLKLASFKFEWVSSKCIQAKKISVFFLLSTIHFYGLIQAPFDTFKLSPEKIQLSYSVTPLSSITTAPERPTFQPIAPGGHRTHCRTGRTFSKHDKSEYEVRITRWFNWYNKLIKCTPDYTWWQTKIQNMVETVQVSNNLLNTTSSRQ